MSVHKYLHDKDHRFDIFNIGHVLGVHIGSNKVNRWDVIFLACDTSSTVMNSTSRNLEIVAEMHWNNTFNRYDLMHTLPLVVSNAVTKIEFLSVYSNSLAAGTNDTNFEELFLPVAANYGVGTEDYNRFHVFLE